MAKSKNSRDPGQAITPCKRPPHLVQTSPTLILKPLYFHVYSTKMPVDEVKLELALQDLRRQVVPNTKATANLYSLNRTALGRRFNRKCYGSGSRGLIPRDLILLIAASFI